MRKKSLLDATGQPIKFGKIYWDMVFGNYVKPIRRSKKINLIFCKIWNGWSKRGKPIFVTGESVGLSNLFHRAELKQETKENALKDLQKAQSEVEQAKRWLKLVS
jgi:hypothetical protein